LAVYKEDTVNMMKMVKRWQSFCEYKQTAVQWNNQ